MAKFAELHDGTKLEFPDDTPESVIDGVVKKHLGVSAKPETNFGENFGIGLNSAAQPIVKAAGMIGGMAANALLPDGVQDSIYKQMDETSKSMEDYWVPKDKEQSFGGKVTSAVSTLPAQLLAMPFSPFDTGKTSIDNGESLMSAERNTLIDTAGNIAGAALPGAVGTGLMTKLGSAFGINAAQDYATKYAIQQSSETEANKKQFQPTLEDSAVAGIVGAPFGLAGGKKAGTKEPDAKPTAEPLPPHQDFNRGPNGEVSTGELHLIEVAHKQASRALESNKALYKELEDAIVAGDSSPETLKALAEVQIKIDHYQESINKAGEILKNPEKPVSTETAKAIHEDAVKAAEKEQRRATAPKANLDRPLEAHPLDAPMHEDVPEGWRAKGEFDPETGEILSTPMKPDAEPTKTTPIEIALQKIGEAMSETKEQVSKRLEKAQAALDDLPNRVAKDDTPGSHYSALKAALEHEIQAYKSMVDGKEPKVDPNAPKEDPVLAVQYPHPEEGKVLGDAKPEPKTYDQLQAEQRILLDRLQSGEAVDVAGAKARVSEIADLLRTMSDPNAGKTADGTWTKKDASPAGAKKVTVDESPTYTAEEYKALFGREPARAKLGTEDAGTAPPDTRLGNPEVVVGSMRRKIASTERNIAALAKQIEDDKSGVNPSGGLDHGEAQRRLAYLEERLVKQNEALAYHLERLGPQDAKFVAQVFTEEVAPRKFDTVADLLKENPEDPIRDLDENRQLVDTMPGTDVHIEKTFTPQVRAVIEHLVKVTRFLNEKVYFLLDTELGPAGRTTHFGNSTVIRLNPEKMAAALAENRAANGFIKYMGKGKLTEALKTFNTARYITHELGHALLNKYLRDTVTHTDDLMAISNDFNKFMQDNKSKNGEVKFDTNTVLDAFDPSMRKKYQDTFHEFFAERITRKLLHEHLLAAFGKSSKGFVTNIKKMIDASIEYLYRNDIDVNRKVYADSVINDILNGSKDAIAETSKQAAERVKMLENDKLILENQRADPLAFPFYKKTLQEARSFLKEIPDMSRDSVGRDGVGDNMADSGPTPLTTKAATELGHGVARKFFGKLGVAKVFRDNPAIQKIHWVIRDAEKVAEAINSKLWFGDVSLADWKKALPWQKMSKVKLEDSAYHQVKNASPKDAAVVHDLFKHGFENELDYAKNKADNGAHLTPKQAKLYDTLAKLFNGQYEEVVKIQQTLGKKNELPKREGWYPAVRNGNYFVDVSFGGTTVHRQYFRSKVEADLFKKNFKSPQHLTLSEITKRGDDTPMSDMFGGFELAQSILEQAFPSAKGDISAALQKGITNVITKGGKLGGHHNFRSNMSGYMGSELFHNADERGVSFLKAIQQSVNDYSGGIRKMQIQHYGDPLINTPNAIASLDPSTRATMQQMVDSAMNRIPKNYLEHVDSGATEAWDTVAKKVQGDVLKANGKDSANAFYNAGLEFFYLTKLMSKVIFPISQVLTAATAIREMSHDGGFIRPYLGVGKALTKLLINDKKLKETLYDVSQKSNTFEPQFMEALHLTSDSSKMWEGVKTYVLLNKVNEAADSLSRMLVFASAKEMYSDLGMGEHSAIRKAQEVTDSTMVPYGKTETAPIFDNLGAVGQAIKPLQTFGQQQLANFVSDFRAMKATNPNSWAPMVNYALVSSVLGGVISVQLAQEYELYRQFMEKHFPKYAPKSLLEIAKETPDLLDRVDVDPDMVQKAVSYGLLPALSGMDVATSMRANQTFLTLLGAVITGNEEWYKMMPLLSDAVSKGSAVITIGKNLAGGYTTDAEMKQAITDVMPQGHLGYLAKELGGYNTTKFAGKEAVNTATGTPMTMAGANSGAAVPRTPTEIASGLLGTKSTDEKLALDTTREATLTDKAKSARIERLYNVLASADPKSSKAKAIMQELVSYGIDEKAIEARLETEAFNRHVPVDVRSIANKSGMPESKRNVEKAQRIFNFGGR